MLLGIIGEKLGAPLKSLNTIVLGWSEGFQRRSQLGSRWRVTPVSRIAIRLNTVVFHVWVEPWNSEKKYHLSKIHISCRMCKHYATYIKTQFNALNNIYLLIEIKLTKIFWIHSLDKIQVFHKIAQNIEIHQIIQVSIERKVRGNVCINGTLYWFLFLQIQIRYLAKPSKKKNSATALMK